MLWTLLHLLLGTGFNWRGNDLFLRAPEEISNAPILPVSTAVLPFDRSAGVAVIPEVQPAFVGSRNVLFINEFRFRQLLNDVFHSDTKELVRAYVDSTGGVPPVQLKCPAEHFCPAGHFWPGGRFCQAEQFCSAAHKLIVSVRHFCLRLG